MTNIQKLLSHNAQLRECLAIAEELPSSDYLNTTLDRQSEIIKQLEDLLAIKGEGGGASPAYDGSFLITKGKAVSGRWLRRPASELPEDFAFPVFEQDINFSIRSVGQSLEPATIYGSKITADGTGIYMLVKAVDSANVDDYSELIGEVIDLPNLIDFTYTIDFGTSLQAVSTEFYDFLTVTCYKDGAKCIKAGDYRLKSSVTPLFQDSETTVIFPINYTCTGVSTGNGRRYTAHCSGLYMVNAIGYDDTIGLLIGCIVYATEPDYPEKVPMAVFIHGGAWGEGVNELWQGWVYGGPEILTILEDTYVDSYLYDWFIENTEPPAILPAGIYTIDQEPIAPTYGENIEYAQVCEHVVFEWDGTVYTTFGFSSDNDIYAENDDKYSWIYAPTATSREPWVKPADRTFTVLQDAKVSQTFLDWINEYTVREG